MTNKKTVLLTGVTGFLGNELLKRILTLNYNVKVIVRKHKEIGPVERLKRQLVLSGFDPCLVDLQVGGIQVLEGNITENNLGLNGNTLQELLDSVDEVFHCAAATKLARLNREDLLKTNYSGTKNILEFCVTGKIKHLHYISTAYVAGKKEGIVYENELEDSFGFHNDYEESKFLAEKAVHNYASTHKLNYTIYRPSIIVGDSKTNHTINFDGIYLYSRTLFFLKRKFVAATKNDELRPNKSQIKPGSSESNKIVHLPVNIPANPEATINLVPIDYVVNAIISISLDRNRENKTFHIINQSPPTLCFILEAINEVLNISGPRIINRKNLSATKMTHLERVVRDKIALYDLYMHNEPYFQSNNARSILDDFYIECPKITKKLIAGLINYAISNNWGNNMNNNHAPLSSRKSPSPKEIAPVI